MPWTQSTSLLSSLLPVSDLTPPVVQLENVPRPTKLSGGVPACLFVTNNIEKERVLGRLESHIEPGLRWRSNTLVCVYTGATTRVLAFCEACRSAQTFHMHIDGQAPLNLCWPTTSHATDNDRSPEVCTPRRVPAVQGYGVTW